MLKKKKRLLCLLMIFIPFPLFSQVIIWTQQKKGVINDDCRAITIDSKDHIYIAGPRQGTTFKDVFLVKYSNNGQTIWTQSYDGGSDDNSYGLALDSKENIYVAGEAYNVNWDFFTMKYDPAGLTNWRRTYNGGSDDSASAVAVDAKDHVYVTGMKKNNAHFNIFTIKYSTNGNTIWTQHYYTSSNAWAFGIALGPADDVYVTGYRINANSDEDIFTIKYDTNGNTIWTQQYDSGTGNDSGRAIAVDEKDNVYVAGYKKNGSDRDFFLIKYNGQGQTLWTRQYNSGFDDAIFGMALDPEDYIYVTGWKGTLVDRDFFTIKYDSDGNTIWTQQVDTGLWDNSMALALDSRNYVYITGMRTDYGATYRYFTMKVLQPPTPTQLLSVSLNDQPGMDLVWLDKINESGYILFRSEDKSSSFRAIAFLGEDILTYRDPDIKPSTEYYYYVTATNAAGRSPPSNILSRFSTSIRTLSGIVAAPNPFYFKKNETKSIMFYNLPDECGMKVYSLTGGLLVHRDIRSAKGRFEWDLKNGKGDYLKNGIYLCCFQYGNETTTIKITIIH